jgi:uncharacterized membrane protein
MVWIVVAAVFVLLTARSLQVATSSTASRSLALLGTLLDALAMLGLCLGLFGLFMALTLGVFADTGLRLTGQSLRDVLITSGALIAAGVVVLFGGMAVRKAAARRPPVARAVRGGH